MSTNWYFDGFHQVKGVSVLHTLLHFVLGLWRVRSRRSNFNGIIYPNLSTDRSVSLFDNLSLDLFDVFLVLSDEAPSTDAKQDDGYHKKDN